jgi:hypothetical protein
MYQTSQAVCELTNDRGTEMVDPLVCEQTVYRDSL